ncbi:MAG TPA: beta-galactosidase [Tepidisphaeraceae bacterium]|nr:beta-galactosidase [Tepidisphaeraceae bacterium]
MSTPIHIGAAWYPELWPEDQWEADVARMKELGVTCVRLFEYAWAKFEPREWEFEFDWATRVLDLLKASGISVICCTPTAAPPLWMMMRYPEIVTTRGDGRRSPYAGGRVASPVSSRYREFCTRVVDQMVHAFRGHESIIAWQIDRDLGGADHGAESRRAFHAWLHERFGSIDLVNRGWGTGYRGQTFEYFDAVPVPPVALGGGPVPPEHRLNPSLMIAFQRFINDQWSTYVQSQVEPIRNGFDLPIVAAMTPGWSLNWFRLNHLLDRSTAALYPDAADYPASVMHFDRMRAEKPGQTFWLLEASPSWSAGTHSVAGHGAGTGSGKLRNDHRTPAGAKAFAWMSVLSGGEMVLFGNFRQHWAGPGVNDGSLVTATGRWAPARDAFGDLAKAFAEHGKWLVDHPPVEARVGVIVSNESAWAFSADPAEEGFDYETIWRDEFYLPIGRAHYWRDVIDQTADYCPYHVVVMPLVPILHKQTLERLKEWVEEGGCLLIGPLTATRGTDYTAFTDHAFGGMEELIGGTSAVRFPTQGVEHEVTVAFEGDGEGMKTHPTGLCEAFDPTTAQVIARYHGGYGAGHAAALIHKVGQGTVITMGCRVADEGAYMALVRRLCETAGVLPLAEGSGHVAVFPRMNPDTSIAAYGLVNLSQAEQEIRLPEGGTDRLTGRALGETVTLGAFEVVIHELAAKEVTVVEQPAEAPVATGAAPVEAPGEAPADVPAEIAVERVEGETVRAPQGQSTT